VYAINIYGIPINNVILSYVLHMPGTQHGYTRHISESPTIRMFSFAFCAITAAVDWSNRDSMNRSWKIWLMAKMQKLDHWPGSSQDRKGVPLRLQQEFQHVVRAGSTLPYSEGHAEP
jgi:hypothetical protein